MYPYINKYLVHVRDTLINQEIKISGADESISRGSAERES
jgi:hypothetical protein